MYRHRVQFLANLFEIGLNAARTTAKIHPTKFYQISQAEIRL